MEFTMGEPLDNNEESKPITINVTSRFCDEGPDVSPPPSTPPPLPPRKTSAPLMVPRRGIVKVPVLIPS